MPSNRTVVVPDLGDFKDVEVVDVLVKEGDVVALETPLVTLETEKATMDVPSTAAGRVARVVAQKGARVSTGSPVVELEAEGAGDAVADAPAAAAPPANAAGPMGEPAGGSAAAAPGATRSPATVATREVEVRVPDLGDFKEVAVIEVAVRPGDAVAVDAPLLTLESEKAAMDVPSPVGGTVVAVHVEKGARVSTGALVATVRTSGPVGDDAPTVRQPALRPEQAPAPEPPASTAGLGGSQGAVPPTPAAPAAATAAAASAERRAVDRADRREGPARSGVDSTPGASPIEEAGFSRAHASPSVRRLARELGVDLARVKGSGPKDRITHEDVKSWVKRALADGAAAGASAGGGALPRVPEVDFAKFGAIEVEPLSRIQRISGSRLHASWVNLPHVTQFDEADITVLEETRARLKQKALDEGIKLTPLAFVVRAVVRVLQQFPRFNASLDSAGGNLVLKKYVHLGFAADTPGGLVVPVIRDAHRKDVYEIARELGALSEKARAGKLSAAEMQGGSFTVSSLGGIGGTAFTPIINAPEVAILGVSRSAMKPVWQDGQFVPRLMLPLSLSYDHRVIDGAAAARFTTALAAALADVRGLLEAVP
ncbi:MAG: dihydrolipoyllysine-residue acetyltransferase [Steroidobacteraceae bacterium]|jgi:pyruvate dehydrogenase E2 component (dihydrolipoamide acetyltransferase)|nr:dihydrolipoyllysine-residue acetyltransferase [Steroidobacteraceae bacterium]